MFDLLNIRLNISESDHQIEFLSKKIIQKKRDPQETIAATVVQILKIVK